MFNYEIEKNANTLRLIDERTNEIIISINIDRVDPEVFFEMLEKYFLGKELV